MNFDLATITRMVTQLAAMLIPGWTITVELAPSVAENQGALAMVYSTPERELAHVVVAPHPPNESPLESVAHELTHSCISPLTKLIEWSPAAVMLEEQIVERIGKTIARVPLGMARAISKALQNPRTNSPVVRKRISALAIGRRNGTRKRMDSKALAALAMEGGQIAAMEGLPSEAADWIKRAVEAMAGGSSDEAVDELNKDVAVELGNTEPAMREADLPPKMRTMFRGMAAMHSSTLASTIRMRIHELCTVDKLEITPVIKMRLGKAASIEDFEDRLELVKLSLGSVGVQRNRSGVTAADENGANGSPSVATLIKDGHTAEMANHIVAEFKRGKEHGTTALDSAMKFRKVAP